MDEFKYSVYAKSVRGSTSFEYTAIHDVNLAEEVTFIPMRAKTGINLEFGIKYTPSNHRREVVLNFIMGDFNIVSVNNT